MRVAGLAVTTGMLVAAVGAMRAASRLDRLHVRTDASWAALDAALCQRAQTVSGLGAGVAMRIAADAALWARAPAVPGSSASGVLGAGAHAAREEVENELSRALALLDRTALEPACARRLADAEQRVVIARRVYNDAVRDTLALRSHRRVRWLRLAGRAPLPRYFEIAEPVLPG
ncbi:MAG: NUDIX hydrolase [Pseudonocardiaceae bacterium]